MTKELAETLKPLLKTRAPFAVFSLEDGSRWFCASCGASRQRTENIPVLPMIDITDIPHTESCGERAHVRALAALRTAIAEAGVTI